MCKTIDFCGISLAILVSSFIMIFILLTYLILLYRQYYFSYMEISAAITSVYSTGTMSQSQQINLSMVRFLIAFNKSRHSSVRSWLLLWIDI